MSVVSLSKERKLEFKARINEASVPVIFTFLNDDGSPHDITSYDFEIPVSSQPNSGNLFKLSIGDGLTVIGAGSNQLQVEVSKVRATQRPNFYFAKLFSVDQDNTWISASWEFFEQPYDSEINAETITINPNGTPIEITITGGGSSSGTDADAIHKNVDDEFSTIPEKTTLSGNDLVLIEDSEDGNSKKKAKRSNVLGTSGSGDVLGPSSAVDSNFAAFDTTTGKLIKDSGSKASDFDAAGAAAAALASANSYSDGLASNYDAAGAAATVQGNLNTHEADTNNPHSVTKSQVGLGDVPNLDTTSAVNDAHTHSNKTILDAIQESFTTALKAAYDNVVSWVLTNGSNVVSHLSNTSNPHSVTKSQVGLGSADNTSDADKPVSTATQTALDLKANLNSPTLVTPNLGTPSAVVLTNATGLPTAGLVDDAVTLAKMAVGTAGNLITYDASGNPAAVATGTAAQVLTSNGAGASPTFQAAAGGGGGNRATLGKINVSAAVTGTTAETIIGSFLVPAASVEANDILEWFVFINKLSSVGNTTYKVYVNDTNNLTTPTQVGSSLTTAGNVYMSMRRTMFMKNSVSSFEVVDPTALTTPDDAIHGTQGISTVSFDLSAAFYFIVTVIPSNSGDTMTLHGVKLERIR